MCNGSVVATAAGKDGRGGTGFRHFCFGGPEKRLLTLQSPRGGEFRVCVFSDSVLFFSVEWAANGARGSHHSPPLPSHPFPRLSSPHEGGSLWREMTGYAANRTANPSTVISFLLSVALTLHSSFFFIALTSAYPFPSPRVGETSSTTGKSGGDPPLAPGHNSQLNTL